MTGSGRGGVPRTVHDGLFKMVFGDPVLAAQELCAVLPPALAASIDWSTMAAMPSEFVDAVFRQRTGDLVYGAGFAGGGEVLLWLLEHQSTEEWWMVQRVLDTQCVMWWSWRRLHREARHLPVIVPVVVYNGPRPWRAPTDMHALYGLSGELRAALGSHVLSYALVLDDLSAVEDEALRSRRMDAYARLCLFAMGRAAAADFLERLRAWHVELRLVFGSGNRERIASFLLYTYRVHRHTDPDTIHEHITDVIGPEHEEVMLSVAEQLMERGFEKGLERGQRVTLLRLLGRRFGPLSQQVAARIEAASPTELEHWLDRVLDAVTLDDVFANS